MNRNEFLSRSIAASVGLTLLPHLAMATPPASYTREQLIGKGNPELTGTTYLTTMHKETANAFNRMKEAAAEEGIAIEVVSAYRSFQRQKEIFERKYQQYIDEKMSPLEAIKKIIEYSTIPGTSRHHWGTDLDLIDANGRPRPEQVLQAAHFHGDGPFCKLKEWLDAHAASFGFYEVYTLNAQRKGFKYEPWHLSYAPVSIPMLRAYRDLNLKSVLQEENIEGSSYFTDEFIEIYRKENILDINPKLL